MRSHPTYRSSRRGHDGVRRARRRCGRTKEEKAIAHPGSCRRASWPAVRRGQLLGDYYVAEPVATRDRQPLRGQRRSLPRPGAQRKGAEPVGRAVHAGGHDLHRQGRPAGAAGHDVSRLQHRGGAAVLRPDGGQAAQVRDRGDHGQSGHRRRASDQRQHGWRSGRGHPLAAVLRRLPAAAGRLPGGSRYPMPHLARRHSSRRAGSPRSAVCVVGGMSCAPSWRPTRRRLPLPSS